MPWFHVPSLTGLANGGETTFGCSIYDCANGGHETCGENPRSPMSLVNPCEHFLTHMDEDGEMHVWAECATLCSCCGGVLLVPSLDWDYRIVRNGAYIPGTEIPVNLPTGTFRCDGCDRFHPSNNVGNRTFDDPHSGEQRYCGYCASQHIAVCGGCSSETSSARSARVVINGGRRISVCFDCADHYVSCVHCGYYYDTREADYCCNDSEEGNNEYLNGCRCNQCNYTRRYMRNVIKNYGYKPRPDFRAIGPEMRFSPGERECDCCEPKPVDSTLYLGFELEVEVNRDRDRTEVAQELQDALGNVAYLKEDGSIDSGFEIVTHPMTLDYAMSEFNWSALRKGRKDRDIHSADNCGLHVHVSKAAFSGPAHEYRWLLFWHRNQVAMRALADRNSSYAEYRDTDRSQFVDIAKRAYSARTERYSAINTNNEHTHEVRVFASTLYINRLRASLQLVEATVEYTRRLASSKVLKDGGFAWTEFVVWLTDDARRYADLLERIRAVVRLNNSEPITAETAEWGVRNRYSGYIDNWTSKKITIQEKATV